MTTILRSTRFALSFALSLAVVGCGDNEVTTPPAPGAPAAPGTPAAPATPGAAVAMPPKATPAVGSNVFNVNGQPNFQEKLISIGFTPDPTVIPVVSGGNLEVSTAHIPGTGCRGWVTARPDVNVRLTTVIPFLRIFNTARGGEDTTLIINKPDGSWVCADDVYGTNPGIDITTAPPGLYNVWIGSYNSGDQAQGQLTVTTSNTLTAVAGSGGAPLNPAGNPNFGARSLAAGFGAVTIDVTSGGNIEARNSSAGSACRGYITAQPDVNVTLTTPVPSARIFIDNARDNADTTLVIQTPDGSYHCDDDTNGNSPQVDLSQAAAGAYHIWVGSYQSGVQAHARLNITSGAAGAGGK